MKSFLASPTTPTTPPTYVLPTADSPLPSYIFVASLFLPPLIYAIHKDYSTFLSLGPGGTRYDFLGYLQITFLRLFALSNPCSPGPVPAPLRNTGFISAATLPNRLSERPSITGIAPHRQTSQRAQKAVFEGFKRRVERLAEETEGLCMGVSSFEKHGPALFSERVVNETKGGEVVHLHTLDGSMHMTLHPEDVKTVLEKGWGGSYSQHPRFLM